MKRRVSLGEPGVSPLVPRGGIRRKHNSFEYNRNNYKRNLDKSNQIKDGKNISYKVRNALNTIQHKLFSIENLPKKCISYFQSNIENIVKKVPTLENQRDQIDSFWSYFDNIIKETVALSFKNSPNCESYKEEAMFALSMCESHVKNFEEDIQFIGQVKGDYKGVLYDIQTLVNKLSGKEWNANDFTGFLADLCQLKSRFAYKPFQLEINKVIAFIKHGYAIYVREYVKQLFESEIKKLENLIPRKAPAKAKKAISETDKRGIGVENDIQNLENEKMKYEMLIHKLQPEIIKMEEKVQMQEGIINDMRTRLDYVKRKNMSRRDVHSRSLDDIKQMKDRVRKLDNEIAKMKNDFEINMLYDTRDSLKYQIRKSEIDLSNLESTFDRVSNICKNFNMNESQMEVKLDNINISQRTKEKKQLLQSVLTSISELLTGRKDYIKNNKKNFEYFKQERLMFNDFLESLDQEIYKLTNKIKKKQKSCTHGDINSTKQLNDIIFQCELKKREYQEKKSRRSLFNIDHLSKTLKEKQNELKKCTSRISIYDELIEETKNESQALIESLKELDQLDFRMIPSSLQYNISLLESSIAEVELLKKSHADFTEESYRTYKRCYNGDPSDYDNDEILQLISEYLK